MNFKTFFKKIYDKVEKVYQYLLGLATGLLIPLFERLIAKKYFEIDTLIIALIIQFVLVIVIIKMVKKEIQNRKEGKVEKPSIIKILSGGGIATSIPLLQQFLRKDFDVSTLIFGIIFIASVIAFCIIRWKEKRNIEINS